MGLPFCLHSSREDSKGGGEMFKKTALVLILALLMTPLYPTMAMSRYYHHSPSYNHYYYGYSGDEALVWALTGLFFGAIIASATLWTPPPREVVYAEPKAPVYTYPPSIPPGMCRWERYMLDDYGRLLFYQDGQPVKQYTLGSCQYPPN